MIKYSFIIPVKAINPYIHEAVPKILAITRDDYEIIIYPDFVNEESWPKTRQIGTGKVGPAVKRTLAINDAVGEILVFIDDDAYPEANFLDLLDEDFRDAAIAAVGGPAITPAHDSFWQKVSGAVFLSRFSGGNPERYIPVGHKRLVNDWPSVNLSVRASVFKAIGGFDGNYWPGEDTKLCLDITEKAKGNILYDPALIAYHHRREGLGRHLKQVGGYGLHRGFFARTLPKNSLHLKYFLPSGLCVFLTIGTLLAALIPAMRIFYFIGFAAYFLALVVAFFSMRRHEKDPRILLCALWYTFCTHLVYGARFLQGFLLKKTLIRKEPGHLVPQDKIGL